MKYGTDEPHDLSIMCIAFSWILKASRDGDPTISPGSCDSAQPKAFFKTLRNCHLPSGWKLRLQVVTVLSPLSSIINLGPLSQ